MLQSIGLLCDTADGSNMLAQLQCLPAGFTQFPMLCLSAYEDLALSQDAALEYGGKACICITRVAFHTGRPFIWVEKANAAMYASKNNATSKSSLIVFTPNSAPDVSADGTSWSIDAIFDPSNTDSAFVYKGTQSFQEASQDSSMAGAIVTTYAPISLLIDDICFDYTSDVLGNAEVDQLFSMLLKGLFSSGSEYG